MTAQVIPLLARRRIEAETLHHVYMTLTEKFGVEVAADVVARAVEKAAEQAGRDFAASASGGPSLQHFAAALEIWRQQGALKVDGEQLNSRLFKFRVTACGYADLYRSLGLPVSLAYTLSCRRDAAFARGYHPAVRMNRSPTIAEGADACTFEFTWDDATTGEGGTT